MGEGYHMFPDLPSIQESEETTGSILCSSWLSVTADCNSLGLLDATDTLPPGWHQPHLSSQGIVTPFDPIPWNMESGKPQQWIQSGHELQANQDTLVPWASPVEMAQSSSSSSYCDEKFPSPIISYISPASWSTVIARQDLNEAYVASSDSGSDYSRLPENNQNVLFHGSVTDSPTTSVASLERTALNGIKLEDVQGYPEYPEEQFNNISEPGSKVLYLYPAEQAGSPQHTPQEAIPSPDTKSLPSLVQSNPPDDDTSDSGNDSASDYCPKAKFIHTFASTAKNQAKPKASKRTKAKCRTRAIQNRVVKHCREDKKTTGAVASLTAKKIKCPQCVEILPNKAALNKHITTMHTRPFTCTFREYGCFSTFGSKNEWKRHVASQHLRFGIWRCDMGSCLPPSSSDSGRHLGGARRDDSEAVYNEFNRKDLFTQHIRRMHKPEASTCSDKKTFTAWLDAHAHRCFRELRSPPPRSVCGYCVQETSGRGVAFQGHGAWEYRMEHVGRHLESGHGGERVWAEDVGLRTWMLDQGLIEGCESGGFLLAGADYGLTTP